MKYVSLIKETIKILLILNKLVMTLDVEELVDDNFESDQGIDAEFDGDERTDVVIEDDGVSDKELVSLLEKKYRFVNDNSSKRYRIESDGKVYPVFPDSKKDRQLAWAFRSYAVRRIIGGMETCINMYPYNVAISRTGKHWCGGSIIDEQWILTAGHCFESAHDGDSRKLVPFIVRAGSSFHNRGGYQARVNKVFFPISYSPGNADFDYSLLRLDRPLPIGRNIAVLNLPAKDYLIDPDDILIVTGWGSTHETGFGHIPERLRFVPVPIMKLQECQKAYRFYITPRMLCAGYATGGKDACNHDSGGPAVRDGVLIGIVSFGGKKCGDPRSPGVYSRVAEITEWVEATISDNEAYTVPELKKKIEKARQRERELKKFKERVEEKKNKIKNWIRETLKSPTFLQLAKKKLTEAGFSVRRNFRRILNEPEVLDERTMDEINLSNLINESILEDENENESELLLRMLAMQEIILNGNSEELLVNKESIEEVEALVAYLTKIK
ncbi:suppressor of tumorigenicity 14 protein homolog isoform X1 [Nymphalis io]|uniref:suppressor of tumorigenicity 14 protein homolog isoform X1 n=1 Tax=Inachis io TaxID=171585 RepID=UPI002166EA43|nr:suppressor of tumorigenicity 14 protein homolog isoform X1 [Nymphalis io]